ncbi:MAG: DUF2127 domain-containing protein [Gemmatimonadota bacterium]|jgi:uncharacterized membrane protein (DUF2068 family)|nr:DUF2127 domain-containing protein [Gemmatimonadota bacterium]
MAQTRVGIRMIACYEAAKGVLVLVAGTGLLLLVHRDAQGLAERLVAHLHLDPAKRFPRIFLHAMTEATPEGLGWLAVGAAAYCAGRFAEAYGLWQGRRWGTWLGVVTAAVYIPFEVDALLRRPGPEPLVALALNLLIVLYLARALRAGGAATPQEAGHELQTTLWRMRWRRTRKP